jgi:hypothetical protein
MPGIPTALIARADERAPLSDLLTAGGDSRLRVDPASGLNAYGCSPTPRPWAITFASTTATSISDYAYRAAEACRQRVRAAAGDPAAAWQRESEAIKRAILAHYGLAGADVAVVLTPSGTDGELCALAVHRIGRAATPTTNLLIAPEETGTGVGLAAGGRHFAEITAHGIPVAKGAPIDGLADGVTVASVAIRTRDGAVRSSADIDADVERLADHAVGAGRRVLLHILDLSKTGLLAPGAACVETVRRRHGAAVDVLVDACQARLSAATVRAYLAAGCMVLVTGSKFFTGPPFAGALLLPPALAARLGGSVRLPAGLATYAARFEFPVARAADLPITVNHGLVLRWVAALAEMRAFAAVPPALCRHVLETFGRRITAAVAASPDLVLHPVPAPARAIDGWDALPTVFSFSVRAPGGGLLDLAALRRLYRGLNQDLSAALPEPDRALAARCCHIGQPVALGSADGIGALRLAAGARLVSGVFGDAALGPDPAARLEREIADACSALDKLALMLGHAERLAALS